MPVMRALAVVILSVATACTSTSNNACPSPLIVEVDSVTRSITWDSGGSAQVVGAVGDCLAVHREKNRAEDSTTWYRIPVTATVKGKYANPYADLLPQRPVLSDAILLMEAVNSSGVVLATDSMVYKFADSPSGTRVIGGIRFLSRDEIAHLAKVRIGFHPNGCVNAALSAC